MTRSGRAVLVVEVEVLADLVEDALDDLVYPSDEHRRSPRP